MAQAAGGLCKLATAWRSGYAAAGAVAALTRCTTLVLQPKSRVRCSVPAGDWYRQHLA